MSIRSLAHRFRGREQVPVRRVDYDPIRDFQRRVNRLFDEFFGAFPTAPAWADEERAVSAAGFSPRVDVAETDKAVKISAEVPGLTEKDVSVEIEESAVAISGERKEEKEEKAENWHTMERFYGAFHRVIPLPMGVDIDNATAKLKNGVLTITVPKREEAQARRKAVKVENE